MADLILTAAMDAALAAATDAALLVEIGAAPAATAVTTTTLNNSTLPGAFTTLSATGTITATSYVQGLTFAIDGKTQMGEFGIYGRAVGFSFYLGNAGKATWSSTTDATDSVADLILVRSAPGILQLGENAATGTNQKLKAMDATAGTGGNFTLAAGIGTVAGGALILQTAATGTLTDRLIILPNGNVGIGTTPISLLHVKGINPKITMSQSSAGEPMTFQFTRADSTTIEAYVDMDGEASNVMRIANQQGDIQFIANAAAAARILSNGSFGIGTTTPASKLAVNGGVHVGGDSDAGDNNLLVDGTITAAGMKTDADSTAGNTRFFLYDVDNATLERVTVGAADTGGAGFKVLRISN